MKNLWRVRCLILSIWFIAVIPSVSAGEDVRKILLTEDPWPPYILGTESESPTGGIAVDVLHEIFRRLNVKLEMKLHPWKRSLFLVKSGEYDGHMLMVKSPEWTEYLLYSDILIEDTYLLWYRADRDQPIEWQDFKDLKPHKIGLTTDYNMGEDFDEAVKKYNLKTDYAKSDEMNFRKLLGKRFDIFICMKYVAHALFKENPEFQGKFRAASKPLLTMDMFMTISKKSEAAKLMPEIKRTIQEMKSDGTMDRLLNSNSVN